MRLLDVSWLTYVTGKMVILANALSLILQSSLKRMSYLLDVHSFPPSDLALNQTVLTWPAKTPAIFERGEKIVEDSKTRGEATLREKQEKVVIEIEKVRGRLLHFDAHRLLIVAL